MCFSRAQTASDLRRIFLLYFILAALIAFWLMRYIRVAWQNNDISWHKYFKTRRVLNGRIWISANGLSIRMRDVDDNKQKGH